MLYINALPNQRITRGGVVSQGGGCVFLARLYNTAGALITQGVTTSISFNAYDLGSATPSTPVQTRNLTVGTVVFDTMQLDARWLADITGYNFADVVPANTFTTPQGRYRVEYRVTPNSGPIFYQVFEVLADRVLFNG